MSEQFKVFKRASAARQAAGNAPYLRVGMGSKTLYVVGLDNLGLDEVAIVAPGGTITGHVTMRHLDRLGNANHAVAVSVGGASAYSHLPDTLIRPSQDAKPKAPRFVNAKLTASASDLGFEPGTYPETLTLQGVDFVNPCTVHRPNDPSEILGWRYAGPRGTTLLVYND